MNAPFKSRHLAILSVPLLLVSLPLFFISPYGCGDPGRNKALHSGQHDRSDKERGVPPLQDGVRVIQQALGNYETTGEARLPLTNQKIEYRLAVSPSHYGPKEAHAWLHIKNVSGTPIDGIVMCAMLNVFDPNGQPLPPANGPLVEIEYNQRQRQWQCKLDAPSFSQAPNYHFGCIETGAISPGQTINPIDQKIAFSVDVDVNKISSFYLDLLRDEPVDQNSCHYINNAQDVFLSPSSGQLARCADNTFNCWFNIWAGTGGRSGNLDKTMSLSWPVGNWVTMSSGEESPSILEGRIEGLPAGTRVRFNLATVGGEVIEEYEIAPAEVGLCEGSSLVMAQEFVIPPVTDRASSITVTLPEGPCGDVEGYVGRFDGEVIAAQDFSIYQAGQYMHAISTPFLRDTEDPTIDDLDIVRSGSQIVFDVRATDGISMVTTASAQVRSGSQIVWQGALDYSTVNMAGPQTTLFHDVVDEFDPGETYEVQIAVGDEAGNVTTTGWMPAN